MGNGAGVCFDCIASIHVEQKHECVAGVRAPPFCAFDGWPLRARLLPAAVQDEFDRKLRAREDVLDEQDGMIVASLVESLKEDPKYAEMRFRRHCALEKFDQWKKEQAQTAQSAERARAAETRLAKSTAGAASGEKANGAGFDAANRRTSLSPWRALNFNGDGGKRNGDMEDHGRGDGAAGQRSRD